MTFLVAAVFLLAVIPLASPFKCVQCDGPMVNYDCKTTFPEPTDCLPMYTYCFQNMTYNSKNELVQVRRGCLKEAGPPEPCRDLAGGGRRCEYTCNTDGCTPSAGFAIANEPSRLMIFIVTFTVMLNFIMRNSAN